MPVQIRLAALVFRPPQSRGALSRQWFTKWKIIMDEIAKQWPNLSDKARWEWVIANKKEGFVVFLDNDITRLKYNVIYNSDGDVEDVDRLNFSEYIGDRGAVALLEALQIPYEVA
jgi:hypothetical protein